MGEKERQRLWEKKRSVAERGSDKEERVRACGGECDIERAAKRECTEASKLGLREGVQM